MKLIDMPVVVLVDPTLYSKYDKPINPVQPGYPQPMDPKLLLLTTAMDPKQYAARGTYGKIRSKSGTDAREYRAVFDRPLSNSDLLCR